MTVEPLALTLSPKKPTVYDRANYWRSLIRLKSREKIWEWCERHLVLKGSPLGKKFKADLTPWIKEPLEEIGDNRNREITCQCCVQGCKTTILQGAAVWAVSQDCSAMFITCQTDDDARDFAKERLNPSLDALGVGEISLPEDRRKRATCYISLPDGFLIVQGANENNLQSKTVRWIFNDEVYRWKQGLLEEARKRGTKFWNRRILNCSTAGAAGEDLDRAFLAGDQREWHLACPACGELNNPKWERIKWNKEECQDNGEWNFTRLQETAKFECEHCKARFSHTPEVHKAMNAGARYIPMNPRPSPQCISFHWNALCLAPTEVSWGELAVEWIKADIEWALGNEQPRREFIQKRLAESWNAEKLLKDVRIPVLDVSLWTEEKHRFLLVDVQEGHFWAMVQGWSAKGDDMIHWADKLITYEDVVAKQKEYGIPPQCVFIDSGDDTRTVYAACVQYGWTALKAEDADTIKVTTKDGIKNSFYSWPPGKGDPNMGQALQGRGRCCPLIRWAKRGILDIAGNRRDGRAKGVKCHVSPEVGEHFHQQMFSEAPRLERNKQNKIVRRWYQIGKRANHLWDCYQMGCVAACLAKVIGGSMHIQEEAK